MLIGRHTLTVSKNLTFKAPASLLAGKAYLTQGLDQNLLLIGGEDFALLYRTVASLSITDPLARLLSRLMLGNAVELQLDSDHHIRIPKHLAEFAHIAQQVMLIGQGYYYEIWSPEVWQEQEARLSDASANASQFYPFPISFA
jgi:MraZ protein